MWIDMKKHFEARSLEWFGAGYTISWGAYVSLHPGMFTDPVKFDLFKGLIAIGPQEEWGFWVTLAGVIRLTALFINGRWGLTPWVRAATSFLSVGVWFVVCVGLFHTGSNTDVATYPFLMIADMFSCFRAASDAAELQANNRLIKMMQERGLSGTSNVTPLVSRH